MGLALFRPPNVGGWKGGQYWMHTAAFLVRINFAFSTVYTPSPWGDTFRWDVSRFFEGTAFSTADELIDFLADRLHLVAVSDAVRAALRAYIALAGTPLVWAPQLYDYIGRVAIYLMMSSPEYQLQ
jgi:hypothetical protein